PESVRRPSRWSQDSVRGELEVGGSRVLSTVLDPHVRGTSACDQEDPAPSRSVTFRYAAASISPARSAGSAGRTTIIHPFPYGSSFTSCGASASCAFRSTTVPPTGAYTSETDLVDSTSPKASPARTSVPTSGTSTYTTSPKASWAKSVIPTRNRAPSCLTHSCSLVYRRSSGNSIAAPPSALPPERVGGRRDLLQGERPDLEWRGHPSPSLPLVHHLHQQAAHPVAAPGALPQAVGRRRDPPVAALRAPPQVLSPRQLAPLGPGDPV